MHGSCSLDQLLVGGLVARLCQEHDLGLASFDVLGHLVEKEESEHRNHRNLRTLCGNHAVTNKQTPREIDE